MLLSSKKVTIVVLFSLVSLANAISPAAIDSKVTRLGVNEAAAEIYDDNDSWRTVLKNVREGKRVWLAAASRLYPSAGAAINQELLEAFQNALDRNPSDVLRYLKVHVKAICNGEDIDAIAKNDTDRRRMVEKRVASVNRVANESLKSTKLECANLLSASI